jgi:hypothetical protein
MSACGAPFTIASSPKSLSSVTRTRLVAWAAARIAASPGSPYRRPLFILGLCHSGCNADTLAVPTGMQLNSYSGVAWPSAAESRGCTNSRNARVRGGRCRPPT